MGDDFDSDKYKFDFIAIDFETANGSRLSACAIGLVFIKKDKIVDSKKFLIKPPINEAFDYFAISLHGVRNSHVQNSLNFKELWDSELSKYFNTNLIVYHNASMDLSVLKNAVKYYEITNFNIRHIDTAILAKNCIQIKKLSDITTNLGIKFKNNHNPVEDAEVCAMVYLELVNKYPNNKVLPENLTSNDIINPPPKKPSIFKPTKEELINCEAIIAKYLIDKSDIELLVIENNNFLVTGVLETDRNLIEEFIQSNGGKLLGVSPNLNYVFVGEDYGHKKIEKIEKLNIDRSCNIKFLKDKEYYYLATWYS